MEGVSSPGTRALLHSYSPIDLVCTPFIRITDQRPSEAFIISQVSRETVRPFSVQLLGKHPENLAYAAEIISSMGAAVVDLNFGCPSRQVMKKGAGAALLDDIAAIRAIVSRVRCAVKTQVSAKIRGGIDDIERILLIAKAIESAGADFLTVHPRSSQQGYAGVADWRWVRRVKAEMRIPVIGNGDCWYAEDALRLRDWAGCDGVMLGRAALRNPFIFRQIRAMIANERPYIPTGQDILLHLSKVHEVLLTDLDGNLVRVLGALKEQAQYLLRAVPEATRSQLIDAVLRAPTSAALLDAMAPIGEGVKMDLASDGPYRLESSPIQYCVS